MIETWGTATFKAWTGKDESRKETKPYDQRGKPRKYNVK